MLIWKIRPTTVVPSFTYSYDSVYNVSSLISFTPMSITRFRRFEIVLYDFPSQHNSFLSNRSSRFCTEIAHLPNWRVLKFSILNHPKYFLQYCLCLVFLSKFLLRFPETFYFNLLLTIAKGHFPKIPSRKMSCGYNY